MDTETKLKILTGVCDESSRFATPFGIVHDGMPYGVACVSTGVAMIVFRGDVALERPGYPSAHSVIDILESPVEKSRSIQLSELKAWAGPRMFGDVEACKTCKGEPENAASQCPDCSGRGYVGCECSACGDKHDAKCSRCGRKGTIPGCTDCENTGKTDIEPQSQRLGGKNFNPLILARPLRDFAEDEDVALTIAGDQLAVWGDGWMVVMMATRQEPDETDVRPDLFGGGTQ